MQLDIRTSLIIATFVSLVPSLLGVLVWQTKRSCPGVGQWALANLLGALCLFLLSLRGTAPDWISIVLGNASALAAAILFMQGIRLFQGLRLYWWPECLAAGLTLAVVIYFRYATNNLNVRTIAMSAMLGAFGLISGLTLLRPLNGGRRLSTILTGSVFILASAANFLRMYLYASAPAIDLLAPSNPNAAFFAAAGLGAVGWSFGFLLMADERLLLQSAPGVPDRSEAGLLAATVPEAEVRLQIRRIVESEIFRRSARMERFLTIAADRTLTGHSGELKEYILGRDVFNRGENYDPRTDSIVRVEAQRLRRKLREYYESDGRTDPIIVELRPGSYVPHFRYKESHRSHGAS